MVKKKNPYGYDAVNDVDFGGRYLAFRRGDKGRVMQLRLASEPRYIIQHWILGENGRDMPVTCTGEDCPYCGKSVEPKDRVEKTSKWGWIAIDRSDGQVKLFNGPFLIARKVKELSEMVNEATGEVMWGDPMTYDIRIERTEDPGKAYYKVDPVKGSEGEITKEEKVKIKEANIDLETELDGSKKSDNTGRYKRKDLETAPEPSEDGKEEVSPDGIPF